MAEVRARAVATGRADPYECRFLRRDGTVRRLRVVGEPVFDANGVSTGLIGTITDITAASEMEERVRQAQKMEMVGQLAGSIAHDFNNLLTVILGGVQEVARGQGASEMLTHVERAARSAAGLTQRLLGFSRQAVVQPEVVDLARVIDDFRPLLGRALGADVAVRVQHADGEFLARLDENQLQQILMNLSVNARDAMGGRGTLTLGLARVSILHAEVPSLLGGDYLRLTVTDTGHGMDPLTAQRIFEPFFTTKPIGKGTGLGLAMVEGAVKQAGGAVVVQTRLGEGTSFHLYLPPAPAPAADHPPSTAVSGSLRVLLVEDDACVRHALTVALESIGCEVVALDSGPAALEVWERRGASSTCSSRTWPCPTCAARCWRRPCSSAAPRSAPCSPLATSTAPSTCRPSRAATRFFRSLSNATPWPPPWPAFDALNSVTMGSPYCADPAGGSRCAHARRNERQGTGPPQRGEVGGRAARQHHAGRGHPSLQCPVRERYISGIAIEWHPQSEFVEFLRHAEAVIGKPPGAVSKAIGAEGARINTRSMAKRAVMYVASPEFLLRRIASLWSQFNDQGEMRILSIDERQAHIELVGLPDPNELFCATITGWCEVIGDAVGFDRPRSEHTHCRARGDEACVWRVAFTPWSPPSLHPPGR
jgi:signal transduction histidine kinase